MLFRNYGRMFKRASGASAVGAVARYGRRKLGNLRKMSRKKRASGRTWAKRKRTKKRKYHKTKSVGQHNSMSVSGFLIDLSRKRKCVGKGSGRYHETWDYVFPTTGNTEGLEAIEQFKKCFTYNQLIGVTSNERSAVDYWGCEPTSLNPYEYSDPSRTGSYFNVQVYDNDKYSIKGCKQVLSVLNLSTIAAKCKIYWLLHKHDSQYDPTEVWQQCLADTRYGQQSQTYAATALDPTVTAGQPVYNNLGQDPFQCPAFRQMFKLLHREDFVLQPGETHEISGYIKMNRIIDKVRIKQEKPGYKISSTDLTPMYVGGLTITPLILYEGALVHIEDENLEEITTGRCKLGAFIENEYVFKFLPSNRLSTQRNFAGNVIQGSHSAPVDTVINEGIINDLDAVSSVHLIS